MSGKRDSPRRVTLAMMKGKPITTSVPVIRYHASDDELEELYPSTDEEKRATPDIDKSSPRLPSSPSKSSDKKGAVSTDEVTDDARADSSLQEGTPPSSDPWKVFSDIKGKITKTFEEKLCEIKSEKLKKSRSPNKENSSISDSEDLGDITPSDENSIDKQKKESSTVRRRGISTHYVGFSRVKTGLKDKTTQDDCVESGVEAAEYSEDVYEGVIFGLDTEVQSVEKPSVTATSTSISGQGTSAVKAPVQIHSVVSQNSRQLETIFPQLTDQLLYPLAYRSLVFVILSICIYYFTPLPEYIVGFTVGVFATVTFCNAIATVKKILVSLPDEKVSGNQTVVPVLEITAIEEHAVVERFEGWLNELPYAYDPENYHVARTKSVFFRLEGDILRIMETRMKIPKRAVWDEPRHKLKFTKRRAYCLAGAQVELFPQGLIRRRRWSKKYPICITLKSEALISNVTLKRSIKDSNIQFSERIRRKAFKKRRNVRRRRVSEKEDDETKRDSKAKQREDTKEDREKGLTEPDLKERRRKRTSFTDETTETSLIEEEEGENDEDDDTLDCEEFNAELEQDEDDGDYDEEEDEEDEFEWEGETDDIDEVDGEDEWHDVRGQRSPMRTSKESKYSGSEEGYEDAKELKMEIVDNETFEDVDGNKIGKRKESEEDDKSTDNKSKEDEATDEKESTRAELGSLRTKGLKKTYRDSHGSGANSSEIKLFIFARADRQKEDWYRRLMSATTRHTVKRNHSPSRGDSSTNSNHGASTETKLFTPVNHAVEGSSELSYKAYMTKYLDNHSQSSSDPTSSVSTDDILWFNGLVARILFDMHKCSDTISLIQDKIQRKLSNIKLPYFMESLLVSEIVIGQGAPVIRGVTKPVTDERGLWLDLDITYKGSLTMTVETKLNLMKLTRTGSLSSNTSDILSTDKPKPTARSPIFDSDVEDTPETSTEDEDTAKMRMCGTTKENQTHSSGRKFLSMVDRIAANKYFQHATELSYVRRAMEGVSNTEIRLMVTVSGIEGCLSVNIPPAPADRLWYGFKPVPKINLTVMPAVGERAVNIVYVTKWIEAKLLREFEKLVVLPNMDDLVLPLCPNFPYMTTR